MRANWKVRIVSPGLFRSFFLKRPTSPLCYKYLGTRTLTVDGSRLLNLHSSWNNFLERLTQKKFFVKSSDYILPAYRDKKFWVWNGKRFIPVVANFDKFGGKFGMYCYTKRYSPIHKGTGFVFKEIRGRSYGSRVFRGHRGSKRGGVRAKWEKFSKRAVTKDLSKKVSHKKKR